VGVDELFSFLGEFIAFIAEVFNHLLDIEVFIGLSSDDSMKKG